MSEHFQIEGLKELEQKLIDLGRKDAQKVMKRALRKAAGPVAAAAKSLAPVRTGALQRSIKIRAGKSGKGRVSIIVGTAKKWFTGAFFYAAFQEFTHYIGSRKLGNKRHVYQGLHFMERAFDSTKGQALAIAEQELKNGIEAAAEQK